MATYSPDVISKAFNDLAPANWKARPYLKSRKNGAFNSLSFTYRGGTISLLMNCDLPVGEGFTVAFSNMAAVPFKTYANAIQKALWRILNALEEAGLDTGFPKLDDYRCIEWACNAESGEVTHIRVLTTGSRIVQKIDVEELL